MNYVDLDIRLDDLYVGTLRETATTDDNWTPWYGVSDDLWPEY